MQTAFRSTEKYKRQQATSIRTKWQSDDYRNKIATGINRDTFISQSLALHGDKFDYSETQFGTWKDPIAVRCRTCNHINIKLPQKQLDFGYCQKCGISTEHRQILEFVTTLADCTVNNHEIIPPYELDIYIPTVKLAIEHHGTYWHSYNRQETTEERHRHQQKAQLCQSIGVKLLQFFDFEWEQNQKLIKSMIRHALGQSNKVNARNLDVSTPSTEQAHKFFNYNHLYGYRSAKYTIALTDKKEIICAASFSKHRDGYELIRLATLQGYNVRGGPSRLISHFKRVHSQPLYTYADLRYSVGSTYKTIGFKTLWTTHPNYFYIKNDAILSRQQCQKHKLKNWLHNFDENLSEAQNMFANGYRRVWDAGHIKFIL
jgi:hypothetical protein